jgi:hypothetical protein
MSRRSVPRALIWLDLGASISMGFRWMPWFVRNGIIETDKVCRLSLSVGANRGEGGRTKWGGPHCLIPDVPHEPGRRQFPPQALGLLALR